MKRLVSTDFIQVRRITVKKILKRLLCVVLSLLILVSIGAYTLASAIGNVKILSLKEQTTSSVSIQWTQVSGARGYRIYRYVLSEGKWKAYKTLGATSFVDENIIAGEVYYYKVKAYQYVNRKAVFSNSYSNTLKVVIAPGKVTGLKAASVSDEAITLSWTKVNNATGYRVYKYNNSSEKYEAVVTTTKTSYTVKNLNPTTTYKFVVKAYRKHGKVSFGANSSVLTVATKVGAVSGFAQKYAFNNGYTLSWKKLSGATGYQIYKYDASANKWFKIKTTTALSYSPSGDSALSGDKFIIRAYVRAGGKYTYGPFSSQVVAYRIPAVPENLAVAKNSNNGITLTWSKVNNVSGYIVYSYSAKNGTWSTVGTTATNSFSVNNIAVSDTYKYAVSSFINSSGKNIISNRCESVSIFFDSGNEPSNSQLSALEKRGIFGYLYDSEEKCFYTSADPWQRVVGYNEAFDVMAPMSLIDFDTMRLKFDYQDKKWMIQLWKGQYGLLFYGAEVGVYTMPKDRVVEHYDCASDDEMLKMSMNFYEYETKFFGDSGWEKKFSRPYGYYWWCTGFLPGSRYNKYHTFMLEMRITMKDSEMLNGVTAALKENGISYTVNGLDVMFTYA